MFAKTKLISALNKFPALKRFVKEAYQFGGNLISDRKSWPDHIQQVSSSDAEHLFGYYDKTPWDSKSERMLYLRVCGASLRAASDESADIILRETNGRERVLANTRAWNVQQGCMLQWFAGDDEKIIYNDYRNGAFCSVIRDLTNDKERILCAPVYSLSADGKTALTLDFSRLHSLRPGYGYCNKTDSTKEQMVPEGAALSTLDINSNTLRPLYTYQELIDLRPLATMVGAYHKVNHIMISPSGNGFMFLHRWISRGRKYDRMLWAPTDGSSEPQILLDEGMVSHSNWRNDNTIITFANALGKGPGYRLVDVNSGQVIDLSSFFPRVDGHPSYSPDRRWVVTDTYPNLRRKQSLYLIDMEQKRKYLLASVYAAYPYRNEKRCDLHPRWSPDGKYVCFDGSMSGVRQVYSIAASSERVVIDA